jgi:hypothetical protein
LAQHARRALLILNRKVRVVGTIGLDVEMR